MLLGWGMAPASAGIRRLLGTGTRVAYDDMEDASWSYELNLPKASSNLAPTGMAARLSLPTGSGTKARFAANRISSRAAVCRSVDDAARCIQACRHSTNKFQQDDLVFNASMTTGG